MRGGRVAININVDQLRSRFPNDFQRLVGKVIVDVQVKLLRKIYKEVVETTPVLTGQARNNWDIGVGDKPVGTILGPTDVQDTGTGTTMTPSEREKVRQAVEELRKEAPGQKVWITNRLDYVQGLDEGSSTKAPHGIRALAVLTALEATLTPGARKKLEGLVSNSDEEDV